MAPPPPRSTRPPPTALASHHAAASLARRRGGETRRDDGVVGRRANARCRRTGKRKKEEEKKGGCRGPTHCAVLPRRQTRTTPPPPPRRPGRQQTHPRNTQTQPRGRAAGRTPRPTWPAKGNTRVTGRLWGGARSGPVSSLERTHRATVGTLARQLSVLPCWCARPVRLAVRRLQRGGTVLGGLARPPPTTIHQRHTVAASAGDVFQYRTRRDVAAISGTYSARLKTP